MPNIATLLEAKGKKIWSIEPGQTAFKALQRHFSGGCEI